MFCSAGTFLGIENTFRVYFPLKPREKNSSSRRRVRRGIYDSSVQCMCRHSGLQDAFRSVRRRVGHYGLRYPEQSDLDCLAALLLSSLTAENVGRGSCQGWPQATASAASALTTTRST